MSEDLEMDSDAREDVGQEDLLDRSFNDWVTRKINDQATRQRDITDVTNGNVWEAADQVDGGE